MADDSRRRGGEKQASRKPRTLQAAAAPPIRPKRPRKTLVDDFAAALRADFRVHGAGVIAAVRAEKPEQYLKVVLTMLPKDFSAKDFSDGVDAKQNSLEQLSDEEIRNRIRRFEANLRPFLEGDKDLEGDADLSGPAGGTGPPASS